ncbi:MAG: pyruvate:ferredoxin (flavodoxin) oxidoreductase [Candidatus Sumerlaeota bacterium]|nr:pyruvate:ferredoxin (flavodoxin) oxidoreductase [Candidatus Sumerlaeota bacterium]
MSPKVFSTIDGNEAAASVAYRVNEVCAIYPITPSSPMGEWADEWSAAGMKNIWGSVPTVVEMQSEGGASGAVHGSLQAGALTTTFTASQGLLLMIPNMFKIAGELTPTVFHVSARTVATHALSIFGDHSDVMAVRSTGFGLIASGSIQEVTDLALIAHAASLKARVPFVHFFDGFRTSHEVQKAEMLSDDVLRAMIDDQLVAEHRARALSPDRPVLRGTAQNPDVFFQARETVSPFYAAAPALVQQAMDQFAGLVGRQYQLFEYHGAPDAERIVVLMGSGCEAAHEAVDFLNGQGAKVGLIKVRLYRPFSVKHFMESLPASVKSIAMLDRTKEPGATGDPLHVDCVAALEEGLRSGWGALKSMPVVVGGRYGLSSKEFTPAMVKGVFDNLSQATPKNHFVIGIVDDVSNSSLPYDPDFSSEGPEVIRALFYGLGSDGTVGANKNSIKIIGENTDNYAQGYFVYDSKKAGSVTVSHLRFGPKPIHSTYLITKANFVACHQWVFLEKYDMLKNIVAGGAFLLNSPYAPEEVWDHLPEETQRQILDKKVKVYTIDAVKVAQASGMGRLINTTMQACFFALSQVLPREEALDQIKIAIKKTYGRKGDQIVQMNIDAVNAAISNMSEVKIGSAANSGLHMIPPVSSGAPEYVKNVLGRIIKGEGDDLPVSAFASDGTFPTATAQYEKRNLALDIPVWDPEVCIQCGKCAIACPHATIRMKVYDPALLAQAPATFKSADAKVPQWKGRKFTIQVAPEDCTGCEVCVIVCPAKNKRQTVLKAINMAPQPPLREAEAKNWAFFLSLPDVDRREIDPTKVREQQMQRPLFEFSGACAGCGETPYVKAISQLFGDRAIIANATGCSSIYGGNLPTTPWAKDANGRGPAWSNSLFEDNAEFGLGFRLAIDKQREQASALLQKLAPQVGEALANDLLAAVQKTEADIYDQRERVAALKDKLKTISGDDAKHLLSLADMLVKKSVWIVGGDGWAYDIGYGGLDHVLASGRNVNLLVLDTEVYSNTGGQMSKATPRGAVAKFAAGGKPAGKKDLGMMAMSYGNVYVASVAMGARDDQTLKAMIEAEQYDGPSIIIAYSHCIAHGIDMTRGMEGQKLAVDSGQWIMYRYNPELRAQGKNPLQLDSKKAKKPVIEYLNNENRFRMLTKTNPQAAKDLFAAAQTDADARWEFYSFLAARGAAAPAEAKEE